MTKIKLTEITPHSDREIEIEMDSNTFKMSSDHKTHTTWFDFGYKKVNVRESVGEIFELLKQNLCRIG